MNMVTCCKKKIYDTDDGDNVIFMNFLPDDTNTNWTSNETEIGYGLITASTCVYVNNEDHYVMYFRDYQLEIRDRINGDIVYHQESDIQPFDIQMDSSNDLLFFVNNEENELISVYKLEDDIYVSAEDPQIPKSIFDMSNYPNPFNPETTITFSIPNVCIVDISIYNLKGQKVKQLVDNNLSAGQYSIIWDGKDDYYNPVSSGIYFYKIKTDKYESTYRKMLLLK